LYKYRNLDEENFMDGRILGFNPVTDEGVTREFGNVKGSEEPSGTNTRHGSTIERRTHVTWNVTTVLESTDLEGPIGTYINREWKSIYEPNNGAAIGIE
jgi:hypothetical protein